LSVKDKTVKYTSSGEDAEKDKNSGRGSGAPGGEDKGIARRQTSGDVGKGSGRRHGVFCAREKQGELLANRDCKTRNGL